MPDPVSPDEATPVDCPPAWYLEAPVWPPCTADPCWIYPCLSPLVLKVLWLSPVPYEPVLEASNPVVCLEATPEWPESASLLVSAPVNLEGCCSKDDLIWD